MVRVMSKIEMFSFILIIVLQFVANAATNMLIPSYGVVITYYNIDKALVGIPDAVFILVSAALAVMWGYFTDRIDRARVIMVGAFMWSIGTLIVAFDAFQNQFGFNFLIFARALTGAGIGCIIPIAYSIMADITTPEERSGYFGIFAILSSLSNGVGQAMSSFLGPLNIMGIGWRFPFFIISIISLFLVILLFFIKLPALGSQEQDLDSLSELNLEYNYQISGKDVVKILKKKSNMAVFIQGFFSIIPGTLVVYFITTMFSDSDIGLFNLLPDEIRIQVSTIMAGLTGIGYIVGSLSLAGLGDIFYKKDDRNRVLLSALSLLFAAPLVLVMIISPVQLEQSFIDTLGENPGIFDTIIKIFQAYPTYYAFVIFSFFGSFLSAGPVSNRGAIMMDANLPEHRGTTTSFFNLSEQLGKGLTLILSSVLLIYLTYQQMIIFAGLFWFPGAIIWFWGYKNIRRDMNEKSLILKERTQVTLIDYIFELEIQLDQGIQKIHDAKRFIGSNNRKAMDKIDRAIRYFAVIESTARRRREILDTQIESYSHNLKTKALMMKSELKQIMKLEKDEQNDLSAEIQQLKYKIEEYWEPSDLGKIEILLDSGNLKVLESRMRRKYNLFSTLRNLKESLEIFERVEVLARERRRTDDSKKLTAEEEEFQVMVESLINRAEFTKMSVYNLKNRLEELINQIKNEGVTTDDLEKAIKLSSEHNLPYTEILLETVESKKAKKNIEKLSDEIDALYNTYDENQANA
jgi:MFS family permease